MTSARTPTADDLCRRACHALGLTRDRAGSIFAVILEAADVERERCRRAVLLALAGRVGADVIAAVEHAFEAPDPYPEPPFGGWHGGPAAGRPRGRYHHRGGSDNEGRHPADAA